MGQKEGYIFPTEDALEMILMFDSAGKILYANDMAHKKLEYENDLCGRPISDIFPAAFCLSPDGMHMDYPFGKELKNLVAYRKNTTCFPVETRILNSEEDPGIYICMANDMLEREFLNKEIEKVRQEAKEALKVKSEFVANVTHELRTPVNGVLGNVRELLDEEPDSRIIKSLRLIERCCGDMNKIINNILDFSKLEAGKFTLEPRKFHFRDMMDYVKSNHTSKINEKGLGLFMTVSPQIPEYIIADELRISQILNNLISNALKFTAVGKITVEAVRTALVNGKMELFFMVKDTGIGISEADKAKLFQSFSQVDASISRKYGGTGLGLYICKQLVELMGGRIEVESEKNKGSTFSFSIWADVCEGEEHNGGQPENIEILDMSLFGEADADDSVEDTLQFGTKENKKSLENNLSKLILSVEMENWEKAEMFMETVRELTRGAPREVSRVVLRLKMAIQKENYDKITAEYAQLKHFLED